MNAISLMTSKNLEPECIVPYVQRMFRNVLEVRKGETFGFARDSTIGAKIQSYAYVFIGTTYELGRHEEKWAISDNKHHI